MNKKFNSRNKFRYFIICNSFIALMFDKMGQGYWITKNNKDASRNHEQIIHSNYKIPDIMPNGQFAYFKALEVTRRDFLKFSRSKHNKVAY